MHEPVPITTGHPRSASRMVTCRRCGRSGPVGKFTCWSCGHTAWGLILLVFVAAGGLKAVAVWCRLCVQDGWLSDCLAWVGSLLGAYLLLGAGAAVFHVRRIRKGGRLGPAEPEARSVSRDHALSVGEWYFLLVLVVGYGVVGNPIDPGWLGSLISFISLLGFTIFCSKIWSSALSKAVSHLPVRLVSRPASSPERTPVTDGICASDTGMTATRATPFDPAGSKAEVTLGVSCAGVRIMADIAVTVMLDGQVIGVGSSRDGFDIRSETDVGSHELLLRWGVCTQKFALRIPGPGVHQANLRHSRLWGKFFPADDRDEG